MSANSSEAVFDLAVIGGGPAGSACALAAARLGLTVALFEAQRELADKPCGEGIMPSGVDALRALGLDEAVADGRVFSSLRYIVPGADPFEIALPRPGVAIDRPRLMQAFESQLQSCSAITRGFGRVEVERASDERPRGTFRIRSRASSALARVLVAADGLHGRSAAWMRGATSPPRSDARSGTSSRIGIRARYTAGRPLDGVEIHFHAGNEVYLTPLAGERVNVSVLLDDDPGARGGTASMLERALAECPRAARRLSTRVTDPAARVLSCRIPAHVARDAAFLAGDAGGGIDPILGCGVTLALESGIQAAQAAHAIVAGDASGEPEREYARAYREQTRSRRALARFLLALSRHPTLARGTFRSARVFPRLVDALVGIAAGDEESAPVPATSSPRR